MRSKADGAPLKGERGSGKEEINEELILWSAMSNKETMDRIVLIV
jgi:hypothetical protein